jgi:response regulator RpfG family c-di-GMP phosphodiesterase
MDHIRSQSGTHFDPQVVEKFLELAGNGREKWKTAMLKMQPAAVHNPAD